MFRNDLSSKITFTAVIAAMYVALTLGFKPLSFGAIQFRIAEVLNLLAFINPVYGIGVTLGCFISNLFSELGIIDIFIGVPATALAVFFIAKTKTLTNNLLLATVWPIVFSGIMVGAELTYVFNTPLLFNIFTVSVGQFGVVTCIGYPLFKFIIKQYSLAK